MASPRICLSLAIMVIAGTLICSHNVAMVSAQCGGSVPDLIVQCGQFVKKTGPTIPPSSGCCSVLKKFDIKCACNTLITKDVVKLISVPKAVFVARYCGLNVKSGMKCGRK